MPLLAGGLARRVCALQLRDSAGLPLRVTGFAFKPSHPGERAPERLVNLRLLYRLEKNLSRNLINRVACEVYIICQNWSLLG